MSREPQGRRSSRAGEILGPVGSGGMGEVYRARDTRLGREVAMTPDGRGYMYGFWQFLHDLYVAEGLK